MIDLESAIRVELLAYVAAKGEPLKVVEMLPGLQDLWFSDERGRYCTEMRIFGYRGREPNGAVFRDGAHA